MLEMLDDETKIIKMGPSSNFDNLIKNEKETIDILKDMVFKKETSKKKFITRY